MVGHEGLEPSANRLRVCTVPEAQLPERRLICGECAHSWDGTRVATSGHEGPSSSPPLRCFGCRLKPWESARTRA